MKWLPNKALEGIAHKTRLGLGQRQRQHQLRASTSEAHHWHVAKKKTRRILSFGNAAYTGTHTYTYLRVCVVHIFAGRNS